VVSAGDDITSTMPATIKNIETVHNYPDLETIESSIKSKLDASPADISRKSNNSPPHAVFFGGVRANDIAMNVVKAVEIVNAEQPMRLILGGRVHDQDRFQAVKAMTGWQFVDHVGQLSFADMVQVCSEAAVAIVLYPNNENSQNVRSNRLFESMALGLPVIVPDFPNWRSFLADAPCGVVADPQNPSDIAAAIDQVLSHPEAAASMGTEGRRRIETRWNWKEEYRRLEGLYDRILQR
jgi:glycosyltransferase involved in cell wall biosynthesis